MEVFASNIKLMTLNAGFLIKELIFRLSSIHKYANKSMNFTDFFFFYMNLDLKIKIKTKLNILKNSN